MPRRSGKSDYLKRLPSPDDIDLWTGRGRLDEEDDRSGGVIDGDTLSLELDTKFHSRHIERVRLYGVNCPEMKGTSRPAGEAARLFTLGWIHGKITAARQEAISKRQNPNKVWGLKVRTYQIEGRQGVEQDMSFSRYIADIWAEIDGESLSEALLLSGNATPLEGEVLE